MTVQEILCHLIILLLVIMYCHDFHTKSLLDLKILLGVFFITVGVHHVIQTEVTCSSYEPGGQSHTNRDQSQNCQNPHVLTDYIPCTQHRHRQNTHTHRHTQYSVKANNYNNTKFTQVDFMILQVHELYSLHDQTILLFFCFCFTSGSGRVY